MLGRRSACQSKCSCSGYCFTCFRACNFSVKCLMLVFRQLVSTVCKKFSVSVTFCFTYAGRFAFLFMSPLLQAMPAERMSCRVQEAALGSSPPCSLPVLDVGLLTGENLEGRSKWWVFATSLAFCLLSIKVGVCILKQNLQSRV